MAKFKKYGDSQDRIPSKRISLQIHLCNRDFFVQSLPDNSTIHLITIFSIQSIPNSTPSYNPHFFYTSCQLLFLIK